MPGRFSPIQCCKQDKKPKFSTDTVFYNVLLFCFVLFLTEILAVACLLKQNQFLLKSAPPVQNNLTFAFTWALCSQQRFLSLAAHQIHLGDLTSPHAQRLSWTRQTESLGMESIFLKSLLGASKQKSKASKHCCYIHDQ